MATFKTIKTSTRPNITTPFFWETFTPTEEFQTYYDATYVATGKILNRTTEVSEDKLSITMTVEWSDRQHFLEFLTDAFCYETIMLPQQTHDYEKNISSTVKTDPPTN
jgi:hypothetical protein